MVADSQLAEEEALEPAAANPQFTPAPAQPMATQAPPVSGYPGNFQASRKPMTSSELAVVKHFSDRQRTVALGTAIVALLLAVVFYAYFASFILFLISFAFVASTPRLAYRAFQVRRAVAAGDVVEIRGTPAKVGGRGGFFTLHFGPEQFSVPLSIYDQFSPHGEGSLRFVDKANLVIAVNGQALLKPTLIRRPRGVFANATWPTPGG